MSNILIIEDDTAIAELEKDYLELSEFHVEIEHEGSEGAARAIDEDFDLILLDLMLPGMDGFDKFLFTTFYNNAFCTDLLFRKCHANIGHFLTIDRNTALLDISSCLTIRCCKTGFNH